MMNVKKILAGIITTSILAASLAVPVMADYEAAEYDIEQLKQTFDDGTITNDIDNTNAKQITSEERVMEIASGDVFSNGYYLSFDFRFDTVNGEVPGYIGIDKRKSSGGMDKQGPLFSYSDGKLRTQTGSSSYNQLCDISPDTWYTVELEGKMVATDAITVMKIYDADHTVIETINSLNLRQFYAASTNGVPNTLRAGNVSMDNIRLIALYPDMLNVTSAENELSAGQNMVMDYTMLRGETEYTKHTVTWSLTGASENVSIDPATGVLVADITAQNQTVTVKASATFGDKTLSGTKDIVIKAVDTTDEKFDVITVSGNETIKAGTSAAYTFAASKNNADVTDSVTADDVIWEIYDYGGLNPYYDENYTNSKAITVTGGKIEIADSVLPQTITLRASSVSKKVFGEKTINITMSDSQKEDVILSDAYEMSLSPENKAVSVDGSIAYLFTSAVDRKFGNQSGYTLTEIDIKFTRDGAGIIFARNDGGSLSTQVTYNSGNLSANKGVLYTDASTDKWYHLEILYSQADASCNIYQYNDDGTLGIPTRVLDIDRRNAGTHGMIKFNAGTCVDNLKISKPMGNSMSVTAPKTNMFVGETMQITAAASRNGLPLKGEADVTWSVLDEDNLPIIGSDALITISDKGLLNISPLAAAQQIAVKAAAASGAEDTVIINIQSSDIFKVTNIGINEDKTKIVNLYIEKNFNYNDEVTFIIAVHDAQGILKGVNINSTFGDSMAVGENKVVCDYTLPQDFDPETDEISVLTWTII